MEELVRRNFYPGEEWVFYKVYCGTETANEVLIRCIQPLVQFLFEKKLIKKWFFIRYKDPDFHLRIRFHMQNVESVGIVLLEFHKRMLSFIDSKHVWNIQLDTYKREFERYGRSNIEDAETFFLRIVSLF